MSKHTPGPWVTSGDYDTLIRAMRLDSTMSKMVGRPIDVAMAESTLLVPIEVAKANAKLIAAAPDLAEALRVLEATFVDDGRGKRWPPQPGYADEALSAARAALKKAGLR